jgi:hypothetical protein
MSPSHHLAERRCHQQQIPDNSKLNRSEVSPPPAVTKEAEPTTPGRSDGFLGLGDEADQDLARQTKRAGPDNERNEARPGQILSDNQ